MKKLLKYLKISFITATLTLMSMNTILAEGRVIDTPESDLPTGMHFEVFLEDIDENYAQLTYTVINDSSETTVPAALLIAHYIDNVERGDNTKTTQADAAFVNDTEAKTKAITVHSGVYVKGTAKYIAIVNKADLKDGKYIGKFSYMENTPANPDEVFTGILADVGEISREEYVGRGKHVFDVELSVGDLLIFKTVQKETTTPTESTKTETKVTPTETQVIEASKAKDNTLIYVVGGVTAVVIAGAVAFITLKNKKS